MLLVKRRSRARSNPGRRDILVFSGGSGLREVGESKCIRSPSATARDRDRIRQQILEKLGWKIHRIWSPDWVTRRGTEVLRLKAAIEAGQKRSGIHISADHSQLSNRKTT